MKKIPLILLVCATPVFAQEPAASSRPGSSPAPSPAAAAQPTTVRKEAVRRAHPVRKTVKAVPTPIPAATPVPQKHSGFYRFFGRLFGGEPKEAEQPLAPVSAPKVSAKRGAKASASPLATPAPSPKPTPMLETRQSLASRPLVIPDSVFAPKALPPQATPAYKHLHTAKPAATPKAMAEVAMVSQPEAAASQISDYQKTKQEALQDAKVAALLEKMQSTPEATSEYKAAAKAYTEALFSKMRRLDPSQQESLDRKEGAYLRRIDAGKPIVE